MKFQEYFNLNDVTIITTNSCNLNCVYCYENKKNNKKMSIESMKEIIDKCYTNFLKNHTKNETFLVNFFGGEPFLNWEVIEFALKYSREQKYNIEFGVTTNLTILTDHMIDIIEEYELGLLISIDGLKETHDRNRCNSYDVVKLNVERLVARKLSYLMEVRMTVMPSEVLTLLDSIKSIIDMGIVNIAPVPVSDTKWNDMDYFNFYDALHSVWDWLFEIYNDNENKKNISIKFIEDYIEQVLTYPLEEQIKVCSAGCNTSCSIGVSGEILPCHQRHSMKDRFGLFVMGNILDDTEIKDVKFNNMTRNGFISCNDCIAFAVCRGGCPSENWTLNNNGNVMNKTQCMLTQIMARVAYKYQTKLLNLSNIRSHRLNKLVQNIQLLNFLTNEVLTKPFDSEEYNLMLIAFYEKLIDAESILLPSFQLTFESIINKLVNINKEIFNK